MLVLSRKQDEKIVIGDDVTITVIAIQGDKVRLGIEAPKDVSVHRSEIYDAIKREASRRASGHATTPDVAPDAQNHVESASHP